MKKYLPLFILFIYSFASAGQNTAENVDTIDHKLHYKLEIASSVQWNRVFGKTSAYGGFDIDVVIKDKFVAGLQGEMLLGEFLKRIVFPNVYEFDHFRAGVLFGYQVIVAEKFSVRPQFRLNYVNARWVELEDQRFFTEDSYFEIRPELNIGYFIINKLTLFGNLGYNIPSEVELIGATTDDLRGIHMGLGLRLTLINK